MPHSKYYYEAASFSYQHPLNPSLHPCSRENDKIKLTPNKFLYMSVFFLVPFSLSLRAPFRFSFILIFAVFIIISSSRSILGAIWSEGKVADTYIHIIKIKLGVIWHRFFIIFMLFFCLCFTLTHIHIYFYSHKQFLFFLSMNSIWRKELIQVAVEN